MIHEQLTHAYNRASPNNKTSILMTDINEVLTALRRVIRAADIHSKRLTKTAGLTAPQLLLMHAIESSSEDSTIGKLAKQISLSQATVTSIIGRLEARGLVTRVRSKSDKRFVWLYLTEKGSETLKGAPTPLQKHFVDRFDQLEDWEKSMILCGLQRLAAMMDAREIDASPFLDVGDLDREGGHKETHKHGRLSN